MEIKINITKVDLLKAQLALLFKVKITYIYFLIIFGLTCAFTIDGIESFGLSIWLISNFISAVAGFIFLIAISIVIQLLTASVSKGYIGEMLYRIDDEGFYEKTLGTETMTVWSSIEKIYQTNGAVYIRINANRFHMIPQRAFSSSEEFTSFAKTLIQKLEG